MQKTWIPVLLFALFFLLSITSAEFATSVVPGWHTTIFPPYFFISVVILAILLADTIGYWILAKRGIFNLSFFIMHMLLTLPAVLFSVSPELPDSIEGPGLNAVPLVTLIIFASFVFFISGQVLFAIYFFRTKASTHKYN